MNDQLLPHPADTERLNLNYVCGRGRSLGCSYMCIYFIFYGREHLQPRNILFSFLFFFPKFAYAQCYQNCEFLKDWAEVLSLAGLAFITVIKGTFGGSASTGPGSE